MGFEGRAFTHDRADEIRSELDQHDDDTILFDGMSVGAAIKRVTSAPNTFGPPVVVYDGPGLAAQRVEQEAQRTLF